MTAVLMAYVVTIILVSPVVASPVTTVTSKHALRPPQFVAPVTALLFTAAVGHARTFHWMNAEEPAHLAISGADLVDLTTARLC